MGVGSSRRSGLGAFGACLLGLCASACFRAEAPACALSCSSTEACPAGTQCGPDGLCHRSGEATCSQAPLDGGLTPADAAPASCTRCASDERCIDGVCSCLVDVSGSYSHNCAVTGDGEAYCWGNATSGRLGLELDTVPVECDTEGGCVHTPEQVAIGGDVTSIAPGHQHTCAVADGRLWCFGGDGFPAQPTSYAGFDDVTDVASADRFSCFVDDAQLYCLGSNDAHQLGHDGDASSSPVNVDVGHAVAQVRAGGAFACLRATDGRVACWGANQYGQLGPDGGSELCNYGGMTAPCSAEPRWIELGGEPLVADEIALGFDHACARRGAQVYCWGRNDRSQLGSAGADVSERPLEVQLGPDAAAEALWAGGHSSCVRTGGGELLCWGTQQRGPDQPSADWPSPTAMPDALAGALLAGPALSATCAVVPGAADEVELVCWGANDAGQLGAGDLAVHPDPVATLLRCR